MQQAADKRQAEIDAERQRADAQREQEAEAARQRRLSEEAQRLQNAFEMHKPAMLKDLKDDDSISAETHATGRNSGLKELDDTPRLPEHATVNPEWMASITDPEVTPIARHLASVVPPLPISQEQVSLNWKQIYLNEDRLEKTGDLVVTGWEMAGLIENSSLFIKGLTIFSKGVIGDLNGAYVYAMKRDETYNTALAYLKDPAQAQKFAHLVDDLRHNRPVSEPADPDMLKAARLVSDPSQCSTGKAVFDALTSREALSAALRKASLEAASDLISYGVGKKTNGIFASLDERKAMFESIQMERTTAQNLMELSSTSRAQKVQLKAVIEHADQLSAELYRMDPVVKRVKEGFEGIAISKATDQMATAILGKEAEGRKY